MRYAREEVIGGYWGKFEGAYGVDVNMVRDGGEIYEQLTRSACDKGENKDLCVCIMH